MADQYFRFQSVFYTSRLTLTIVDFSNDEDCTNLRRLFAVLGQEVLKTNDIEKFVEQSMEYYRYHGRIHQDYLGGRRPDRAALWLIRLRSPDSPLDETSENAVNGTCIGVVTMIQRSVVPDQGWSLLAEYRGNGFATEAAREILQYFRYDLGIQDIMAPSHPSNPASKRVALRLGYVSVPGGLPYEDGVTLLDLQMLPEARQLPNGLILYRLGQ